MKKKLRRVGGSQRPTLVVVYDPAMPAGPQTEAALAEYKAKNPECVAKDPKEFDVIYVESEIGKELTERLIRGEGPGRFP